MTLKIENCGIVNLKEFLEQCLKTKVLNYSLKTFTKLGDHYGSIIKALTVEIADAENV